MTILITSDIHLVDNARDADRWNLFPWLSKQITKTGAKHLLILGDVTEEKDRHSSKLVNRIVTELFALAQKTQVLILKGNHDYFEQSEPFFNFVNMLNGSVEFITKPTVMNLDDGIHGNRHSNPALFLPSTRDYKEDWKDVDLIGGPRVKDKHKFIFAHQTFKGAKAENGQELDGIPSSVFKDSEATIISGDIHVPQKIGPITYVGSPYRVHFGDNFTPRVLLVRNGQLSDLYFPYRPREVIDVRNLDDVEKKTFEIGTQIKIRVRLKRAEHPDWPAMRKDIKALAERRGWELVGLETTKLPHQEEEVEELDAGATPEDTLLQYAKRKGLEKDVRQLGQELLKEALT